MRKGDVTLLSHGAGPYRSATLSIPRARRRPRRWLLALVAAVTVSGGAARRATAPKREARPSPAAPAIVLRDVGPLRPLEGVTELREMHTPQGQALMARVGDGSLRRIPLDEDARVEPGLIAQRALAAPLVCTPRGGDTRCFEDEWSRRVVFEGGQFSLTPLEGERVRLTCRDRYRDAPGWSLEGTSFVESGNAFCLRGDDGRARCFATQTVSYEDQRQWDADCESMQGAEFSTPVAVQGVAVGDAEACAWTSEGRLFCADVRYMESARVFHEVGTLDRVARVWMGSRRGAVCAKDGGGRVWCRGPWGEEVEDFDPDEERVRVFERGEPDKVRLVRWRRLDAFADGGPFQEVPELTGATDIRWGSPQTACAILPRGRVACWGWNHLAQIADGSAYRRFTPTRVEGLAPAADVSAGKNHACAVLRNGSVVCWGENEHGQLGDKTRVPRGTPRAVPLPARAVQVAAGAEHSCARTTEGIWCWGEGSRGALGDGEGVDARSPVRVVGLDEAVELSAGAGHTCARTASGEVYCWGRFDCGWPGQPGVHGALHPLRVELGGAAVRVRSFGPFACAELAADGVRCWGMAEADGRSDAADRTCSAQDVTFTPRRPTLEGRLSSWAAGDLRAAEGAEARAMDVTDPVEVAEGDGFGCALTRRGELWCQGDNNHGQLGDGRAPLVTTPTLLVEATP